jgi:hypothetical protein
MNVVNETNKIILKRMTNKIFTDEQEGKGNALRAVTLLIKDGHITKEDLECLAHIMEHWYGKNEQMTWEDLMALPEGTTAKEAVDSIMQKFVIESELKGSRLKAPAVNVLGALLHMDIKAAGIGRSWGGARSTKISSDKTPSFQPSPLTLPFFFRLASPAPCLSRKPRPPASQEFTSRTRAGLHAPCLCSPFILRSRAQICF